MGVSGSGKSTVSRRVAACLQLPFCEGDDLHPGANIAKMRAGAALDERDREPWLARIHAWLRDATGGGVASCSALKRAYSQQLQDGLEDPIRFVLLDPPRSVLAQRLADRTDHFMPQSLLDSQLETLERPGANEPALRLTGDEPVEAVVEAAILWLRGYSRSGALR